MNSSKALGILLKYIREWSHNLNSKYDYDYLLERVRKIGTKNLVYNEMRMLRDLHKDRLKLDNKGKYQQLELDEIMRQKVEKKLKKNEDNKQHFDTRNLKQLEGKKMKKLPAVPKYQESDKREIIRDYNPNIDFDPEQLLSEFDKDKEHCDHPEIAHMIGEELDEEDYSYSFKKKNSSYIKGGNENDTQNN